jgi:hypothetical protein
MSDFAGAVAPVKEIDLEAAKNITANTVSEKIETAEEPKAEIQPEKPKEDDDFAHRMALLARKEKALTEKQREIKTLEDKIKKLERMEQLQKEDPDAFLTESGLTLDQLINSALNKNKPETVEDKIAKLEKKLQEKEEAEKAANLSKEEQAKKDKHEAARSQVMSTIEQVLEEKAEEFGLVKSLGEKDLVYAVMEQYWEAKGELLPVEDAAKLVEDELFNKVQSIKSVDKIKKLFAMSDASIQNKLESSEIVSAQTGTVSEPINQKTLTARSVPSTEQVQPKKMLSREESLKKIAKDLEAKLAEQKRLRMNA